jgi:hypothetical protein
MRQTAAPTGAEAPPLSLPARFIGMITSPTDTYRSVVAHPRWLGVLAVATLLSAFFAALPLTTDAGQEAMLRSQVQGMESFGLTVTDEAYEGLRRGLDRAPYTAAGAILIASPIITLVFAGILFAVFTGLLGGDASFKQVFTVFAHASVISTLGQVFTGPVNYFRGEVTSATNLAVFLLLVTWLVFPALLAVLAIVPVLYRKLKARPA